MGDNTSPPPPLPSNGTSGNLNMTAVQKLRAMLADPDKFITCPGVYDGFTARIALQEGVECLYMVSFFLFFPKLVTRREKSKVQHPTKQQQKKNLHHSYFNPHL